MTETRKYAICEVCDKIAEMREGGRVCNACMGYDARSENDNGGDMPGKEESTEIIEPAGTYICPEHGEHSGTMIAGKHSKQCPVCVEQRRVNNYERAMSIRIPPGNHTVALGYWLRQEQEKRGLKTPGHVALVLLMELMPAEVLKEYWVREVNES